MREPRQNELCILVRRPLPARYASRGQALIIAVLIMFLLAGLAGVFIALISNAMYQTARAEERIKLEAIAQAGMNHALNELRYSADAADWHLPPADPADPEPGWTAYGSGRYAGKYKLNVSYGPTTALTAARPFGDNPLDRFIKVEVEARLGIKGQVADGRPFLTRKLTAYVPVGLTDYLRWVHNAGGSSEPAILGTHVMLEDPQDPTQGITTVDDDPDAIPLDTALETRTRLLDRLPLLTVLNGPICVNGDLQLGDVRIELTNDRDPVVAAKYNDLFDVRRTDTVQVFGSIKSLEGAANASKVMIALPDGPMTTASAKAVSPLTASRANFPFIQTHATNPVARPILPPEIDAVNPTTGMQRYRALTRDSGKWNPGFTQNTGYYGAGEGLYVNNPEHLQYDGNIDALFEEWLDPTAPNWESNAYHPEYDAVEVTLHDWQATGDAITGAPYIELHRADGVKAFYDAAAGVWVDTITLPYPRNGVLYAEGNLIVKGNLPPSLAFDAGFARIDDALGQQRPGGWRAADGSVQRYQTPTNRRFDLTIVSNGTIYIEGNLLAPSSRYLAASALFPQVTRGSDYDSKLALLARDNVCLNPTKLFTGVNKGVTVLGSEKAWVIGPSDPNPLTFTFATAGAINPRMRLLLRHAGRATLGGPDYAVISMMVNGQQYRWDTTAPADPDKLFFCQQSMLTTLFPTALLSQWGGGLFASDPFNAQFWPTTSTAMPILPLLQGYGAQNTVQIHWEEGNDYLLSAGTAGDGLTGFLLTNADVEIDALIYAQRGSWFVIPGKFYNEDPTSALPWPYPKYKEPLDVRIIVHGAIAENHPAPLRAQEAWTRHWRGANIYYYDQDGDRVPDLLDPANAGWDPAKWRWGTAHNRRCGIEYHYDATLMRPVCFDLDTEDASKRYYRPRLPKLPVSPSVFSFEAMRGV